MALPQWAVDTADGTIEVDPDLAYPVYLGLLGIADPDQFWVEVARRCLITDLKSVVGSPLNVRILAGSGDWALAKLPAGGGPELGAATFRSFYSRIEGQGLDR